MMAPWLAQGKLEILSEMLKECLLCQGLRNLQMLLLLLEWDGSLGPFPCSEKYGTLGISSPPNTQKGIPEWMTPGFDLPWEMTLSQ